MTEHYFAATPSGPSRPVDITVELDGVPTAVRTDRAMFSPNGLDGGTAVLLDIAPAPPAGATVADVGCGWGPIAIAMARREPTADIWAVDVNERAVATCRANVIAAGVPHVRVTEPDGLPADLVVDRIYSNPPIRIGKTALHGLLSQWLPRLAPTGVAYLVVQKNLGADSLGRWMTGQGYVVERLASRQGYRVFAVALPGTVPAVTA